MTDLAEVIRAFNTATGYSAHVWRLGDPGSALSCVAGDAAPADYPDPALLPAVGRSTLSRSGSPTTRVAIALNLPGSYWLTITANGAEPATLTRYLALMAPVTVDYLRGSLEVEHAANELAERYEEINLLYTISEILGRTITQREATAVILREVSETVGAGMGAILVHDGVTDTLQVDAATGVSPIDCPPISADDADAISARAFRQRHPLMSSTGDEPVEAERPYRSGATLAVPIIWTTPEGGEPLGAIVLSARRTGQAFSAGDLKLVAAIATQIAAALKNARLVRESLSQLRLTQEMELAHDLQMRLLPDSGVVGNDVSVAARVVPAEKVGGDFYNLFPLPYGRTGVMIGDVSGHGYRAALIMALAMSASTIHAQTTNDPGEMLNALRASLQEELLTTEMYISVFYGIIDSEAGLLRFANTGHPYAFLIGADGEVQRLPALDPPLGMSDDFPSVSTLPWHADDDLLVLFTDGVSDARDRANVRIGESAVLQRISAQRQRHPEEILDDVFSALMDHTSEATRLDDLTLLLLRSRGPIKR